MKHHLFYLVLFSLLSACCHLEKKQADKPPVETQKDWGVLEIRVSNGPRDERIGIFSDNDTCRYYSKVTDSSYFKKHGFSSLYKHKFILTKQERDTLYACFKDVMSHPAPPVCTVSCYAGKYVSFRLNSFGNPAISCDYSSITDWNQISPSIKTIYRLTFKKVYTRQVVKDENNETPD